MGLDLNPRPDVRSYGSVICVHWCPSVVPTAGNPKIEDGRQTTDGSMGNSGNQEDGRRGSDVRSRRAEDRGQRSEGRGRTLEGETIRGRTERLRRPATGRADRSAIRIRRLTAAAPVRTVRPPASAKASDFALRASTDKTAGAQKPTLPRAGFPRLGVPRLLCLLRRCESAA